MKHRPTRSTIDWGWTDDPGPQTESSEERGFDTNTEEILGESDGLDPDEAGDIADEGPGHRG